MSGSAGHTRTTRRCGENLTALPCFDLDDMRVAAANERQRVRLVPLRQDQRPGVSIRNTDSPPPPCTSTLPAMSMTTVGI